MIAKRFIYFIIAAFITGNLILIFIQYNSEKNINNLIEGNQKLLNEFKISNELKTLESDVVSVENKIRGTVTTNDTSYIEGINTQMAKIEVDLDKLQRISDDDSSEIYILQLSQLIQKKLQSSNEILDAFTAGGKSAAEEVILTQRGKRLTDSILVLTQKTINARQNLLAQVTETIDNSVKKVQRWGSLLIIFILISAAILFWYIINTIRTQIRLIHQISYSEKTARDAARVKENFLANMSHEIRTPINAILGFTNLLLRKDLENDAKKHVQTIQRSSESLLSIVNDILDLSKIEAGMMRIEKAPFSLRGLLHSVEAMFKSKANEEGLELLVKVEDDVPDILEGDATRLTQILVNLLSNAIKFTEQGSIQVAVSGTVDSAPLVHIHFLVKDTGIGIEPEKLQAVFDRFQQADEAITRQFGGTGLGLSIVKELIALQNGEINVQSELGKGTSFQFVIPYNKSTELIGSTLVPGVRVEEATYSGNVRILIVEDNEVNQSLLQHLFLEWHILFEIANNGVEALEKLKRSRYDLILMDIQMPFMDGYRTTQEIRSSLKLTTPIIAMTAHAMAGEKERCMGYGMDEYIAKPVRSNELYALIGQFVKLQLDQGESTFIPAGNNAYEFIDLTYMREVSVGNVEYERLVTSQFLEAVPEEMAAMEKAWVQGDTEQLRKLAHNLRTTVSVMGLNAILQPYLDTIEHNPWDATVMKASLEAIKSICISAQQEAEAFLKTIE
ncbi:ATP-binding protein [Flavisolibacter tropicus]|uniref:Sensory/regulatory protein RpfC n=1 Tax=Flavisolibacter tropicus TaxID=1492898 RepID=A0A172TQE1_9BACT|nr:ATP-binding protein [Flavisolibacter tropicus]ANE49196.1 hypothetical protein SY85_00430 [Flavisolibacter tropicus]